MVPTSLVYIQLYIFFGYCFILTDYVMIITKIFRNNYTLQKLKKKLVFINNNSFLIFNFNRLFVNENMPRYPKIELLFLNS